MPDDTFRPTVLEALHFLIRCQLAHPIMHGEADDVLNTLTNAIKAESEPKPAPAEEASGLSSLTPRETLDQIDALETRIEVLQEERDLLTEDLLTEDLMKSVGWRWKGDRWEQEEGDRHGMSDIEKAVLARGCARVMARRRQNERTCLHPAEKPAPKATSESEQIIQAAIERLSAAQAAARGAAENKGECVKAPKELRSPRDKALFALLQALVSAALAADPGNTGLRVEWERFWSAL